MVHSWVRLGTREFCGGAVRLFRQAGESQLLGLAQESSKWGWALATAGVGISSLLSGIAPHSSVRVVSICLCVPSKDSTARLWARLPMA